MRSSVAGWNLFSLGDVSVFNLICDWGIKLIPSLKTSYLKNAGILMIVLLVGSMVSEAFQVWHLILKLVHF